MSESKNQLATVPAETGRIVKASLADFESRSAHYPEKARKAGAWLFQFMHERCNGSPALVAETLRKINRQEYPDKEQYVYQVTTGRYFRTAAGAEAVANLVEMVERLEQWDKLEQQRGKMPFNENLRNWTLVRDYIDSRRARGSLMKFGMIQGETGDGKSANGDHYQLLNNHGMTVTMEAPSVPLFGRFVMKLGSAFNIPRSLSTTERLVELDENVNEGRTIIIQNIQKLYNPKAGTYQPIFSYLQELQDERKCTIIGTWTPTFRDEILTGKNSRYFQQFVSRLGGIDEVLVLRKASKADLKEIMEQFEIAGGQDTLKLLGEWSREVGSFRLVYQRIQRAQVLCGRRGLGLEQLEQVKTTPLEEKPRSEGGDE